LALKDFVDKLDKFLGENRTTENNGSVTKSVSW
jgi:hypothetical protein